MSFAAQSRSSGSSNGDDSQRREQRIKLCEDTSSDSESTSGKQYGATSMRLGTMFATLVKNHLRVAWRSWRIFALIRVFAIYCGLVIGIHWFLLQQLDEGKEATDYLILFVMGMLVPFVVTSSQLVGMQVLVAEMVAEKESKMKAVLMINGVPSWVYWASYLTYFLMLSLVFSACWAVTLWRTCFPLSNLLLVFAAVFLSYVQTFFAGAVVVTFFDRVKTAASISVLFSLFGVVAPAMHAVMLNDGPQLPEAVFFAAGLLPAVSIGFVFQGILSLQRGGLSPNGDIIPPSGWGVGATFFGKPALSFGKEGAQDAVVNWEPSAGEALLFLVAQTVLVALFAYWFDQVWQGEFGAAKPKLFCLMPEYMCPRRSDMSRHGNHEMADEEGSMGLALECLSVRKEFLRNGETFVAVHDMSLDVRRGEVFALLGHNGAGKTTAINCITGMMPLTSGDAFVFGHSVRTSIEDVRCNLGVCPQDNPIYERLSVGEHIRLFSGLRGSTRPAVEAKAVLSALGLWEKRDARCNALSGGQKRRLWVATALVGDTPVVFLDEPTSGMDPASRRELWELLISMKARGRALLFTTHYLEEADLLADRKGIMSKGRVEAMGTSRQLKAQYGVGYHLRVLVPKGRRDHARQALWAKVRQVPGAAEEALPEEEETQAANAPAVVSFTLPLAALGTFGPLLEDIEASRQALGIVDYEVAMTSLEEVFMKIGHDASESAGDGVGATPDVDPDSAEWSRAAMSWQDAARIMVWVRWREAVADKRSLFRTLVMPVGFVIYIMVVSKTGEEPKDLGTLPPMVLMTPGLCLSAAVTTFAVTLVRERTAKVRHVMMSQGMPPLSYWAGTLVPHYSHALIIAIAFMLTALYTRQDFVIEPVSGDSSVVTSRVAPLFVAVAVGPISVLLCAYNFSYFFDTPESVMRTLPLLEMFLGGMMAMLANLLLSFGEMETLRLNGLRLHAAMSVASPYYAMPGCILGLSFACRGGQPCGKGPAGFFGEWYVFTPLLGGALWSLALAVNLLTIGRRGCGGSSPPHEDEQDAQAGREDEDVLREAARAKAADPRVEACLYRDLRHTYGAKAGPVHAVRGISLGVQAGECFGLLGPNGAGKTTTLSCLTGEIRPPTAGEVFISGHSVTGDGVDQAFKHLGFCPQVDPLSPQMTGLEHIELYSRLKGVPAEGAPQEAARILERLGFAPEDSAKPSETYSGGMKRKLSLGIALAGASSTLLLDEPSAAVDAAAKRHLWRVIKRRRAGQTVVVTTHSMEEAEALCDRLAIQVLGKLRCLGTPIYIKGKYGSGYHLELLLEPSIAVPQKEEERRIVGFVHGALTPAAELLEGHRGRYVFRLPPMQAGGLTLGRVFTVIQAGKEAQGIVDYSIAQPSLEQVFLRFAAEQQADSPAAE